jgi:carbon storage regulator
MLVLSRKAGQRIQIGSAIEVAVLSARKGRVKLGVVAPPSVTILRQEIDDRDPADAESAAGAPNGRHVQNEAVHES